MTLGGLLRRSGQIWLHNALAFGLIGATVFAPIIAYTVAVFGDWDALRNDDVTRWLLITMAGAFVLGQLATAALAYGVVQDLKGAPASIGRTVGRGLSRMFPVLGITLVISIAIGLGYAYFVIPGLIMQTSFYLSVPCAVVERTGVDQSMKRSMALTRGYKFHLFVVVLLLGLVELGLTFAVGELVGDITSAAAAHAYGLLLVAVFIATATLRSVTAAVAYHELRLAKEGIGIDELAAVFD